MNRADRLMYQAKIRKNMVVTERDENNTESRKILKRQRILIVDDSEMNRAILIEMLNGDFEVLEAENGQEALDCLLKTHTLIGASMLEKMEQYKDEKLIKIAYQICRWHHERYDGRGYPDGLKGEEIPIAAQVVSLADVYDALVSKRAYKAAFSHEKAMEMILGGECGTFNPMLLENLVEIQDRLRAEIN